MTLLKFNEDQNGNDLKKGSFLMDEKLPEFSRKTSHVRKWNPASIFVMWGTEAVRKNQMVDKWDRIFHPAINIEN